VLTGSVARQVQRDLPSDESNQPRAAETADPIEHVLVLHGAEAFGKRFLAIGHKLCPASQLLGGQIRSDSLSERLSVLLVREFVNELPSALLHMRDRTASGRAGVGPWCLMVGHSRLL
jgi:hypothetical protein